MIDLFYLFIYKIFSFLVRITPQKFLDAFLSALSSLLYNISSKYQKVIRTNLHIAFGDITQKRIDQIGKRTYLNFLHNIAGFIRRQKSSPEAILKDITFVNDAALKKAISEDKKIIFITAHYGNWELLPVALTAKYAIKMSVVGKALKSDTMQNILKHNREQFGIALINKQGAMREMIKALDRKESIGLLVDHHTTRNEGVIVNFFGKEVTQTMSASMLARKFDAVIFPVFISSDDFHHYTLTLYPQINPQKTDDAKTDIQAMTQLQADAIEKAIRHKPDEWFWLHRRWKYCCEELY